MAIENAKTLNVRIRNKYDSYENWAASSLVLEAGEIAIAYTTVDVKVDNGSAKHPALLMKVGNGTDTFANLPWMSAKAADVLAVCKNETDLRAFINGVITDAGVATDEALKTLSTQVTTNKGNIETLQGEMDAVEAKAAANEAAIAALDLLVGDDSVADQIKTYVDNLNLGDTYAAKVHGHAISEVDGLEDRLVAAKKAGDDASEALGEYKTLNDAAVKVNSDAIAAMKKDATITTFKGIEEALAGKQAAGDYSVVGHKHEIADVNGLQTAIDNAQKAGTDAAAAATQALTDAKKYTDDEMTRLVGDTKVATQIENYVNGLKLADTYAAKEHTHTKSEITDFAHNHEMGEINGLAAEFAKKVDKETGKSLVADTEIARLAAMSDGANKVEASETNGKIKIDGVETVVYTHPDKHAIAEVDGLSAALAGKQDVIPENTYDAYGAAADALEDAKDYVDGELERLVGTDTVNTQISTALENALKVEKDGEKVEKYALATDLAAEAVTIRANAEAIGTLNGNAETAGSVDYKIAQAVAAIMDNPDETKNSINELVTWIDDHAEDALEMSNQVAANKAAIETLTGDATKDGSVAKQIATAIAGENLAQYAKAADLNGAVDRIAAVEGDLNTAETGLKARMTQAEADIEALEGLTGGKKVSDAIDEAIEAALKVEVDGAKVDKYALASALTAAIARIAQNETDIATKANDADLAAIAKTGSTDNLVQGNMTLVFNCGGAN